MIVTTRPDKPPTLQHYYPHLSAKERALILSAYNKWRVTLLRPEGPEAHHGLLPFISMQKIGSALVWMTANESQHRRIWAQLCSKVEAARWFANPDYPTHTSWQLVLSNMAVYRHFGSRPDLGVTIPLIPKEKCRGPLKWNIGAKEWQPERIQAAPRITLTKLRETHGGRDRSVWLVHAPTRYKELVIDWLLDHCFS